MAIVLRRLRGFGRGFGHRSRRRDGNENVKRLLKDKKITEDDERRAEDDIQKLTDRFVKEVDTVAKAKEEELMAL